MWCPPSERVNFDSAADAFSKCISACEAQEFALVPCPGAASPGQPTPCFETSSVVHLVWLQHFEPKGVQTGCTLIKQCSLLPDRLSALGLLHRVCTASWRMAEYWMCPAITAPASGPPVPALSCCLTASSCRPGHQGLLGRRRGHSGVCG